MWRGFFNFFLILWNCDYMLFEKNKFVEKLNSIEADFNYFIHWGKQAQSNYFILIGHLYLSWRVLRFVSRNKHQNAVSKSDWTMCSQIGNYSMWSFKQKENLHTQKCIRYVYELSTFMRKLHCIWNFLSAMLFVWFISNCKLRCSVTNTKC